MKPLRNFFCHPEWLLIVLTSVFLSFTIGSVVFAEDPKPAEKTKEQDLLKVYYSESLGTGEEEKVFHLTSCKKAPAYAPLRCEEGGDSKYADQCKDKEDPKKIAKGQIIRGCLQKDGKTSPDKPFPPIDPNRNINQKAEQGGCSDKPEEIGIVYARQWAVVTNPGNSSNELDWVIEGTIAWNTEVSSKVPPKLVKEINEYGLVAPFYRPTLCVTWDVIDKPKKGEERRQAVGTITGIVEEFYKEATEEGEALITAGCNNDNSGKTFTKKGEDGQQETAVKASTPFNALSTYTCSILYRITGKTGVEIFSKYIGSLYKWAASIVGIIAVLIIVYSGIQISMAGADTAKLDSAKHRIMQSIIGLAILFLSGLILYTINPSFFTG